MPDRMMACPSCGTKRRVRHGRSGLCRLCWGNANIQPPTPADGLTGGHWARRGLIWVWIRQEAA